MTATLGVVLIGTALEAMAASIVIQPAEAASKDTQIVSGVIANNNYGNYAYVIDNWGGNLRGIGLVEFDLSGIPAGASVTSATFSLFHAVNTEFNPATFEVFRVTSAWNESTVTYNTAPSFNAVAAASLTFSGLPGVYRDWDVTTLVQAWVAGAFANYGMWIEEIPVQGSAVAYFSSSSGANRPKLTVNYTVPEPGVLALLGLGLVGFVARRRVGGSRV